MKLVNAPGNPGMAAGKSPQIVKSIGAGNVVTLAKPGQTVAGKQTIVINKPGAQGIYMSLTKYGMVSIEQLVLSYLCVISIGTPHLKNFHSPKMTQDDI